MSKGKESIFVSYKRSDGIKEAEYINVILKASGYKTFFDILNIDFGDQYIEKIESVIPTCKLLILVFSPDVYNKIDNINLSNKEPDSWKFDYVQIYELKLAVDSGVDIMPIFINDEAFRIFDTKFRKKIQTIIPDSLDKIIIRNGATIKEGSIDKIYDDILGKMKEKRVKNHKEQINKIKNLKTGVTAALFVVIVLVLLMLQTYIENITEPPVVSFIYVEDISDQIDLHAVLHIYDKNGFDDNYDLLPRNTSGSPVGNDNLSLIGCGGYIVVIRRPSLDEYNKYYDIKISNITGNDGIKFLQLSENTFRDTFGNGNRTSISFKFGLTDNNVWVDTMMPIPFIIGIRSNMTVVAGETLILNVELSDAVAISSKELNLNDIVLNGFTADKKLEFIESNNYERVYKLTLDNIKDIDGDNYVTLSKGAAEDLCGNKSLEVNTNIFEIK